MEQWFKSVINYELKQSKQHLPFKSTYNRVQT